MGEWIPHNLGELIEVQNGYAFKSKDFDDFNGIPVIKIKNVASGELRMDDIKYYPLTIEGLERFVISKNDILIALTGSHVNQPSSIVGKVARYTNDEISLLNQRVGKIYSLDEKETNEDYIYWFFKQWEITLELALNAGGSVNQANISGKLIKTLELELPPLPEQKAIASVLSSLDDKIDLLHRQNKTLEAMAETLFRQWFVEEAQEDWEEGKLGDFVTISYGKNLPTKNLLGEGYPVFGANGQIGYYNKYTYEQPQVLVSCRGEASGKVNISPPKSFVTNNSLVLERNKRTEVTFEYLKYFSLDYDFKLHVSGSAQPQITIDGLYDAVFSIPPADLMVKFSEIVEQWEAKRSINAIQLKTLEKLRDTLLPKLMSGEVCVKYEN